jgi:uncharacterized RDD family membrane protein YckC
MTNSNDLIKIDTPENVTFDYEVAGIGSRFLAALVDTTIIVILQVIVFGIMLLIVLATLSAGVDDLLESLGTWLLAIAGLISFILIWGYYIAFELFWNGQTPGKRWIGLRVIRVDGTPISASESIIRNLVRLIDFMPMAYGVGVVTMFINSNSRRVGDITAGTVVVYDGKSGTLSDLTAGTLTAGILQEHVPNEFPVERLTQQDMEIIEEYLRRRADLTNRQTLARYILKSIIARLELAEASIPLDRAEDILAAVYKARHPSSDHKETA